MKNNNNKKNLIKAKQKLIRTNQTKHSSSVFEIRGSWQRPQVALSLRLSCLKHVWSLLVQILWHMTCFTGISNIQAAHCNLGFTFPDNTMELSGPPLSESETFTYCLVSGFQALWFKPPALRLLGFCRWKSASCWWLEPSASSGCSLSPQLSWPLCHTWKNSPNCQLFSVAF